MYIKSVSITNFKGFINKTINFQLPDGKNLGSGLNINVGENNSGKSTLFEAIDFVRNGIPEGKELVDIKNLNQKGDVEVEIIFCGEIYEVIKYFAQDNKVETLQSFVYLEDGIEHLKIRRTSLVEEDKDKKGGGKITDHIKQIDIWNQLTGKYENKSGISAPIQKLFEMNCIWADTSPDHIYGFGKTTICGRLLSEIIRTFSEAPEYTDFVDAHRKAFNEKQSGLHQQLVDIESKASSILRTQFNRAEINFHFDELDIDSFFKNVRVKVNDGIETYLEEKGTGMQRSVALALVQVYADKVSMHDEAKIQKPFYLFIDEPEVGLHPQAQKLLLKALKIISKNKQVFINTHSVYFIDVDLFGNIYRFKNSETIKGIEIFWDEKRVIKAPKEQRNLYLHHKNIFFTDKVLFVEGVEDMERISLVCESDNLNILLENIYVLGGKNAVFVFEPICKIFGIKFYSIVDNDFSFERSYWEGIKVKQMLDKLKNFCGTEIIDWEKLQGLIDQDKTNAYKPRDDKHKAVKITLPYEGKDVPLLKIENCEVYPLSSGEIEDYIDKTGKFVDPVKAAELKAILAYISQQ